MTSKGDRLMTSSVGFAGSVEGDEAAAGAGAAAATLRGSVAGRLGATWARTGVRARSIALTDGRTSRRRAGCSRTGSFMTGWGSHAESTAKQEKRPPAGLRSRLGLKGLGSDEERSRTRVLTGAVSGTMQKANP